MAQEFPPKRWTACSNDFTGSIKHARANRAAPASGWRSSNTSYKAIEARFGWNPNPAPAVHFISHFPRRSAGVIRKVLRRRCKHSRQLNASWSDPEGGCARNFDLVYKFTPENIAALTSYFTDPRSEERRVGRG